MSFIAIIKNVTIRTNMKGKRAFLILLFPNSTIIRYTIKTTVKKIEDIPVRFGETIMYNTN